MVPALGGVRSRKGTAAIASAEPTVDRAAVESPAAVASRDRRSSTEDAGAVADADVAQVCARALERGLKPVGNLGSGNHFLKMQVVEQIYDDQAAAAFGRSVGQACVMIHCGSRGLGSGHLPFTATATTVYLCGGEGLADANKAGSGRLRGSGAPHLDCGRCNAVASLRLVRLRACGIIGAVLDVCVGSWDNHDGVGFAFPSDYEGRDTVRAAYFDDLAHARRRGKMPGQDNESIAYDSLHVCHPQPK